MTGSRYRLITSFDDPAISSERWNSLLSVGETDEVFLTYEYQRAWWEIFGTGDLRIMAGYHDGELRSLLPLYGDSGMLFNVGAGADYWDVVGGSTDESALAEMLRTAVDSMPEFVGIKLFHIPAESSTPRSVEAAARRLGWRFFEEERWSCPVLDISNDRNLAVKAAGKRSLVRHESFFQKNGELVVEELTSADEMESALDDLFAQHIARWHGSGSPSLFHDSKQQDFYREIVRRLAPKTWVRFTRVLWDDRPIALHFGFEYKGKFLWYKPSFDISLAKRSPGEVLLRHLLLTAGDTGCRMFDFGLGEEAFKMRFANNTRDVVTLGLYP